MFVQFLRDSNTVLKALGCDLGGYKILSKKNKIYNFHIKELNIKAAHILKQEALATGADFALPKEAILFKKEQMDGILMLTKSQSKALLPKLKMQPFGLKNLAKMLESHLSEQEIFPKKIMGILNVTNDSFYKDSCKSGKAAQNEILSLIENGADIIDIGAVSTKPGSVGVSEKQEKEQLKDLLDFIKIEQIYKKVALSIDTYTPSVARLCLENGFSIVNDITGFKNPKMLEAINGFNCACVVMHMQGIPQNMQDNPTYDDLFLELDTFFEKQIEPLVAQNKEIILDVGIGFGKTLEHNLALIRHLGHFSHFGYPLLIGASRKSLINLMVESNVNERLSGTLALHLEALNNGASILRVHDVKEHKQALEVWKYLKDEKC